MPKMSVRPLESMNSSIPNTSPLRIEKKTIWNIVLAAGGNTIPPATVTVLGRALHLARGRLRDLVALDLVLEEQAIPRGVEVVLDVLVGVHRDVNRHLQLVIVAPHDDLLTAQPGEL